MTTPKYQQTVYIPPEPNYTSENPRLAYFYPEDGGTYFIRNAATYPPEYVHGVTLKFIATLEFHRCVGSGANVGNHLFWTALPSTICSEPNGAVSWIAAKSVFLAVS
jgi:hypothetical protein